MGTFARFLLVVFVVLAGLAALLLGLLAVTTGDWTAHERAGAAIVAAVICAVATGAWFTQRTLDPSRRRERAAAPVELPSPDGNGVVTLYSISLTIEPGGLRMKGPYHATR